MASTAIPFVFPAVKLHREWFGDGALRQLTPLSPAIHFGADRILAVGAGSMAASDTDRESAATYPTLAQVAGHALAGIYVDSLTVDLERAARINRTLAALPPEARDTQGEGLRPVQMLTIVPSKRLDLLAAEHEAALPWAIRWLLSSVGGRGRPGGAFASYLLFERPYIGTLIELGYQDTMARRDEVAAFLGVG
jgi:NTE family protein